MSSLRRSCWSTLLAICSTISISAVGLEALTSSMIIPCHYTHFEYLIELLESVSQQTRLPDEVIVALSGTDNLDAAEVARAIGRSWPFKITWLPSGDVVSRGGNRNRAAEQASGDILICTDADDLMHPRRIELCMRLLESDPWPQMILHGLILSPEASPKQFQWVQQLPFTEFCNLEMPDTLSYLRLNDERPQLPYHPITSGAGFIYRSWFERGLRWDTQSPIQEDLLFNGQFMRLGGQVAFVNQPLYYYMYERSAGYNNGAIRMMQFRNRFLRPFLQVQSRAPQPIRRNSKKPVR